MIPGTPVSEQCPVYADSFASCGRAAKLYLRTPRILLAFFASTAEVGYGYTKEFDCLLVIEDRSLLDIGSIALLDSFLSNLHTTAFDWLEHHAPTNAMSNTLNGRYPHKIHHVFSLCFLFRIANTVVSKQS